jgi:endonuclease G
VPLEITVRLADASRAAPLAEAIRIDPDYSNRAGYDPAFLGRDAVVGLPTLTPELAKDAATNSMATSDPPYVLAYNHFSVVLNKVRRLAFFTAVNIDGASGRRLKRETDHWYFDPRVPREEQTGGDVYAGNDLDLGHLVRRLDPTWGDSDAMAKAANDDTFHFTNCTPQHKDFNRSPLRWAGLEDYILDHADNERFKVNVFTGPVLASDDDQYRDVQLPRQFWKVVTMVKTGAELSASGYLVSQEDLIRGLELQPERFSYGEYRTYQVPVRRIQDLTGLSFGTLVDADPLEHKEAAVSHREVGRLEDIEL